jgi:hypothetical protein
MSQNQTPGLETPDNPLILHHPPRQSDLNSETPRAEVCSLGETPERLKYRLPASEEFWGNDEVLIVNDRRRNGLILCKPYHAEFAGPGSAVGGMFDRDCQQALSLGNVSLVCPESAEERQRAYKIRLGWIKLIKQITDNPVPLQRAQLLLNQFEGFFDATTIAQLPDEALALLVGVFPQTIKTVRMTR